MLFDVEEKVASCFCASYQFDIFLSLFHRTVSFYIMHATFLEDLEMEEDRTGVMEMVLGVVQRQIMRQHGVEMNRLNHIGPSQEDTNHVVRVIVPGVIQQLIRNLHGGEHRQTLPTTEDGTEVGKAIGEGLMERQILPRLGEVIHHHLDRGMKVGRTLDGRHKIMIVTADQGKKEWKRTRVRSGQHHEHLDVCKRAESQFCAESEIHFVNFYVSV